MTGSHYLQHVPSIAGATRTSPEAFLRSIALAVVSMRQPFIQAPRMMEEWERDGVGARCLFAHKAGAMHYAETHLDQLWTGVMGAPTAEKALWPLLAVPGLGVVKAAFVLQMAGFDIACLDARNVTRDGRDPGFYRSRGNARKQTPGYRARVVAYCRDTGGRAQEYWDVWCEEQGERYGMGGEACSRMHLDCVVPARLRAAPIPVPALPAFEEIPF